MKESHEPFERDSTASGAFVQLAPERWGRCQGGETLFYSRTLLIGMAFGDGFLGLSLGDDSRGLKSIPQEALKALVRLAYTQYSLAIAGLGQDEQDNMIHFVVVNLSFCAERQTGMKNADGIERSVLINHNSPVGGSTTTVTGFYLWWTDRFLDEI
jgi:hypothetical protein